jgi:ABC-type glutathione transport system ATPase component
LIPYIAGHAHRDATISAMLRTRDDDEDHSDPRLSSSAAPLIEARNLTRDYPSDTGTTRVVDDVSFNIFPGETLGLVGESGSGKTTVARMLLHLIEPSAGEVLFEGVPLPPSSSNRMRAFRRRMQIVFQDPYAALNPRMSVRQILAEPFAIHHEPPAEGLTARLAELLRSVGLDESALSRYPHEFSGGQRQRINIARALALRPAFLVLDEPVSALDVSVGAQVINLLRDLQRTLGLTYLFISHSMPLVRYLCDRVAVMQRGHLVEIGGCLQVCESPLNPYTRQLIAATPEMTAPGR